MSFLTTKNAIKTILDTLTGPGAAKLFRVAFDYFEPSPDAYPAVMVGTLGGSSEVAKDFISDETAMVFVIRALMQNKNDKATHDQLLDALDKLLIELRKNSHYTLGGTVHLFEVAPSIEVFYTDRQEEPVIGFDVTVMCKVLNTTL
jgi:hypothetical protein